MSDVVKDFNTEELIEYLKKKNLKLEESHFKILCKEEIAGSDFLNTSKEEFQSYGMKAGPAKRLAEFIESLGQGLWNYSSLKTLDDLKEMLRRNKVNGEDITSIKQFTPGEWLFLFYTALEWSIINIVITAYFFLHSLRGD